MLHGYTIILLLLKMLFIVPTVPRVVIFVLKTINNRAFFFVSALKVKLMLRRPINQLVAQGIMPCKYTCSRSNDSNFLVKQNYRFQPRRIFMEVIISTDDFS